jgi:hypothetical protein
MGVAGVMLLVVQGMQSDTDRAIEFNARLKSAGELRRANQSALESMSQMLTAGSLAVPLPSKKSAYSSKKTKDRQAADEQELLTGWALTKEAAADGLFVDRGNPNRLRFVSCGANKLTKEDLARLFSGMSEFECDRILYTDVTMTEVRLVQHSPGRYTESEAEARQAMSKGQMAHPVGDSAKVFGWELYGLVRRNLKVVAYSRYDKRNLFSMGTAGASQGSGARSGELETEAVLSTLTDVEAHECRWSNPNWQERVKFAPPIAGGGWGPPMYAYVSRTRYHPGNGGGAVGGSISMSEGIKFNDLDCEFKPNTSAKDMTGWVGGMHQKLGTTKGWGADVCHYGTMFYVEDADQVNCRVNLIPLRWEGNYVGGCFAPGTPIRMADGKDRPVETIAAGDLVYNPLTGRGQRVASVRKGYEGKPLVEVGYGGRTISVTENHPFVVKGKELRQARHLVEGDEVLGADGRFHAITTLRPLKEEPYAWVHNLALESDSGEIEGHVVLANGILTGDHFLQNQLEAKHFAETGRTAKAAETRQPHLSALVPPASE